MNALPPEKPVDLVELGFMESRAKLIDLAAFFDRVQRHGQDDDFRVLALRDAVTHLCAEAPERAARVLQHFSDQSTEPIKVAHTQGAAGAVDPLAAV